MNQKGEQLDKDDLDLGGIHRMGMLMLAQLRRDDMTTHHPADYVAGTEYMQAKYSERYSTRYHGTLD